MAASTYIKSAASDLRRAAEMKKREIDDIRREIDRHEREKQSRFDELKRTEAVRVSEAQKTEVPGDRDRIATEISSIRDEESKVEQEKNQVKGDLADVIPGLERDMRDLLRLASDLERRASMDSFNFY